ncbi:MAG: signal transduction histidine kinase [Caulobacteraceae bacterium]|nr:signal transduction histidine kinase [Caulobacteraceae bacterium]
MNLRPSRAPGVSGIRLRLAASVALALLPVLLLGAIQSAVSFKRDAVERRADLVAAALRAGANAESRISAADVALQTLNPGSVGAGCQARLEDMTQRLPGFANIFRVDAAGRVVCSARPVSSGDASARTWFRSLVGGAPTAVGVAAGSAYANNPALVVAVRVDRIDDGAFAGAVGGVMPMSGLQAGADPGMPADSRLILIDRTGQILAGPQGERPPLPKDLVSHIGPNAAYAWSGRDAHGAPADYSAARLLGQEVFVVLSAPAPSLFSLRRLDPISAVLLPLLAFGLALLATLFAAERAVIQWFAYLERVAGIYAKGRYSVRPVRAQKSAPSEIQTLAASLSEMAATIEARDHQLRDNLVQKDQMMREIHHRVKNNLQVISSLLNMQQRALSDPEARSAVNDTRQRITALALIYRALYQGEDMKRVDLRPFLEELTAQLLTGEGGAPVRTEVHAEPLVIDPDKLAPIALFAVEAISNAQRHAILQGGGMLTVDFKVAGEMAQLVIADHAAGPSSVRQPQPEGVSRTLMTAFARQLRGTVSFEENADGGLTVRLSFPAAGLEGQEPS